MRTPKYKGVVDSLAAQIRAGRWPAGHRLPTHRKLAADEGIAVVTASRVYAELEAMGLVSSEQGRGTFVRDLAAASGEEIDQRAVAVDAIDLSFNSPSVPGQADLLRQALRDLAGEGDLDALLRYQPHRGRVQDRAAVARHLRRRGLDVGRERVLIVNGAQHGLAVTAMALFQPGDVVAVDAVTYPGFIVLARTLGLELSPLPVTEAGPDLDALEQLCRRRRVRAVYAMPTLHNPLGWVHDDSQRARLVSIANRYGVSIIEDASYAYLVEDAPPPLAMLAPDLTVYVSGLSKNVATGLRIGFIAAPAALVPALERVIRATTWHTPGLTAAIACRWLDDGTVDRLEAQKRNDARLRQSIASEVLAGLPCIGHPSSYFLWLPLARDARPDRIAAALAGRRVAVSTAEPFAATPTVPQALRLALGSVGISDLRHALHAVRQETDRDPFS
ncbi:PLP-dependent aminotransferase family protein [Kribbella sp. VKM Ac-2568]|uniref:aminotransferase-like domain-containing protein n=1 Tax=Kribbella sp. VKM Ac-2568 TaxID=2512219 RepID=UPI001044B6EC|nr:PLP-dependent aminotransferase family protein [Kribbella sp. VKM Ac-2568]TCM50628.1 DNA-binding transcriptional MocR family regulator [Kribbella sp. VKM Ac-2568]